MASNGRVGVRSGSPSFLVVGLSLIVIVLLYSYWSVSSRNGMLLRDQAFLQDRLRSLTSQKAAAEKKKSSAMAQVANIEKTKRQLEGDVASSTKQKSELSVKIKVLEQKLDQEKKTVAKLQDEGSKNKDELEKLKGDIQQTSQKLKELTAKGNSFVDMYKNLKVSLAKKNEELFKAHNGWEDCKVKLNNLRKEQPENTGYPRERGHAILKKGINRLKIKNQMKPQPIPTQVTLTDGRTQPGIPNIDDGDQLVQNASVAKTTNNKSPSPVKQSSGNDTTGNNIPLGNSNVTKVDMATQGILGTNTTHANVNMFSKNSTAIPTTNNVEDEPEGDNPQDTPKGGLLESVIEGDSSHNAARDDKVGANARSRNFETPRVFETSENGQ